MKYLLDTNICIYIIKQRPKKVFDRFRKLVVGDIGISAITYAELEYGVANSQAPDRNRAALTEFLAPLELMDFQAEVAILYGSIRADLTHKGRLIGPLDLLIAAHALYLNMTLVTNNTKEFSRVPNLRIDNWV